jgi:peptidylprolyl isomerase
MAQARMGDRVRVHYTGTLADGTVFDTTQDAEPLEFTLGGKEVIPGFEAAVVGLEPGESTTTTVPAADAYGPRRQEKVAHVERRRFPGRPDFKVGQQLQIKQNDGQTLLATVVAVTDALVTLDANHPLAGKDLTYRITLVSIVAGHGNAKDNGSH